MIYRLLIALSLMSLVDDGLFAQDTIWLSPTKPAKSDSTWNARPIKQINGKITQFNSKQLRVIVTGDEAETLAAAHRVIWIESTGISDTQATAMKLFADGQYAASLRPFIDAVGEKPPVWRQQWLSMLASFAAWRGSQSEVSLELVSQLDARPLAPLIVAWLPVDWDGSVQPADTIAAAREKLRDKSAAVRLVAASWLIASAHREAALAVLDLLALDNQRPIIARLAEVVRWRAATPPQIKLQADIWQSKIDALPIVLQPGPIRTLVNRFKTAGLKTKADKLRLSQELTGVKPTLK